MYTLQNSMLILSPDRTNKCFDHTGIHIKWDHLNSAVSYKCLRETGEVPTQLKERHHLLTQTLVSCLLIAQQA